MQNFRIINKSLEGLKQKTRHYILKNVPNTLNLSKKIMSSIYNLIVCINT